MSVDVCTCVCVCISMCALVAANITSQKHLTLPQITEIDTLVNTHTHTHTQTFTQTHTHTSAPPVGVSGRSGSIGSTGALYTHCNLHAQIHRYINTNTHQQNWIHTNTHKCKH